MRPSVYYFAYGSNMHLVRFTRRVPSAESIEAAVLPDHVLRFHKRGRDGSAKCNVIPQAGGRVVGVVYRVSRSHQRELDRIEGRGYVRGWLQVKGLETGSSYRAFAYRARSTALDQQLRAYDWYKDLVVSGAEMHGLPDPYIDFLKRTPCRADVNMRRHRHHLAVMDEIWRPTGRRRPLPHLRLRR